MTGPLLSILTPRVAQFGRFVGVQIYSKSNVTTSVRLSSCTLLSRRAMSGSACLSKRNGLPFCEFESVKHLPAYPRIAQGCKSYRSFTNSTDGTLDPLTFETLVEDTLQNLFDFFEQLGDECSHVHTDFDVTYSSGVLTVQFGPDYGTYVINKQTPNKQIWLSSPTSGPKRYDYVDDDWVYSHDGVPMLSLLSEEVSKIVGKTIDLNKVMKIRET